jgi:hypothetical protein
VRAEIFFPISEETGCGSFGMVSIYFSISEELILLAF